MNIKLLPVVKRHKHDNLPLMEGSRMKEREKHSNKASYVCSQRPGWPPPGPWEHGDDYDEEKFLNSS